MTDHIADDEVLAMRDIADGLLESSDGRPLGRVADIAIGIGDGGQAYLTHLVVGPEALAGRVSSRLRGPARWLLKSRFEHEIPIVEVARFGPTINLRHEATRYGTDRGDAWVQRHILRHIPGNGGTK